MAFAMSGCGNGDSPIAPEPEMPDPTPPKEELPEYVEIQIGHSLDVSESQLPLTSRNDSSNDLIGVEIKRLSSTNDETIYASGVFDDIDDIVFKFVPGDTYKISMTYYPDAKDYVYNYPDGTYGAPFSYIYGLKEYTLNNPVYYGGVEGGWSGDQGPVLSWLTDATYQPGEDQYIQSFLRGETIRYNGIIPEIKIDVDTEITMDLKLCIMGITLNPTNFDGGELQIVFRKYYNAEWTLKPSDENRTKIMQIPYIEDEDKDWGFINKSEGENIEIFYTTDDGDKYLLGTKWLKWKRGVNYVFSFDIKSRNNGSIGLRIDGSDSLVDTSTTFD